MYKDTIKTTLKITVKITAAITAGGRSSRFGSDKALFKLGEKTLLEWVASSFEPLEGCDHRMIIAPPGRYTLAGWETLPEKQPGRGPLGGLEVALEHSKSDWTAFAAVDLPFLTPAFWEILVGEISLNQHMLESLEGKNQAGIQAGIYMGIQALVPLDSQNQVQPLCALYHRSSLPFVQAQLHRQNYALKALLERMTVCYVAWEKLEKVSRLDNLPDNLKGNLFFNLNSPKDLQTIRGR